MALFDSKKNLIIVSAALAAAVAAFLMRPGISSKPGLYESVRKATRYMEENKYDKGIYYLHKAYEQAPESPDIGMELVKGYLKYAKYLDSSGNIDLAIEKVTIAYEMMPENLPVINDLAYYLSERAIERSFKGDMIAAREDLDIALILVSGSGKIRTNIANYLFNRAIEARDKKEVKTQMLCIEKSYELRPRFEAGVFLGDSFYDLGELETALFYWDKALSLKPDDLNLRGRIEKAEKEILLMDSREVLSTTDFEVVIYGDNPVDRDILEEHLLEVYNTVGSDLEYYPPSGTRIVVYDEKDFRDVFKKEGIVRGFYDGSIRIAITGELSDVFFSGLIAHEYTHAVLSLITENNCPIWLHEGIAVYEQSRYVDIGFGNLVGFLKDGGRLSLSEIEAAFGDISDHRALALAYEASHMAVLFIIDEWGVPALKDFLDRIRDEGHYVNALDEKFYISVQNFEKKWNEFAKKTTGSGLDT